MSLTVRAMLPNRLAIPNLAALPKCASPFCPRPPTMWQRWWARHEGVWLEQNWYCSLDCFESGLFGRLEQAAFAGPRKAAGRNRLPLGLVLLSQGEISQRQLGEALERQRAAGSGKLGEWLVRMGAVSEEQVTAALAAQQGCPVFPLNQMETIAAILHWPERLVHRYRAVPLFHNRAQRQLFVGFLERVDHGFLLAVEQVLRCRTRPCIVPASTYRRYLELRAAGGPEQSIEIHQPQPGSEMTRTIANYAEQVHAERCTMAGCHDHLWARLEPVRGPHLDFLFRLPLPG